MSHSAASSVESEESARAALIDAMGGIASCATACECCRMHQRIAFEALSRYESAMRAKRDAR